MTRQFLEQTIEERIAVIVMDCLSLSRENLKPNLTFEELGADSLDLCEIGNKLEEEFDYSIMPEQGLILLQTTKG